VPHSHPALYEIFTRLWLSELSHVAGRRLTLAEVPDEELDRLAALGFEYVWLMGAWTLGELGPRIAREHPVARRDFASYLPDWTDDDVVGSPYAIARYEISPSFGGDAALAVLRQRLADRGIRLILDFVPNHLARDHHWVSEHPEVFVHEADGSVACGRDPWFPPWTDTSQLDWRLEPTRALVQSELLSVAARCDGLRCDMAMLLLEEVFSSTWVGHPPAPGIELAEGEFWDRAIAAVKARHPRFLFIAEVYWGLEGKLQSLGFDATYDKELYDALVHGDAAATRARLALPIDLQNRSVRFSENHDEPRLAGLLAPDHARAVAVIAASTPGISLLHEGQLQGRRIRSSVHLGRRAAEEPDPEWAAFYVALLRAMQHPAVRDGQFTLLEAREAWSGNPSCSSFVAWRWDHPAGAVLVAVNLAPHQAQCRIPLEIDSDQVILADLLDGPGFVREAAHLRDGLYVDLPAFGIHFFAIR
jgi:hypothetical protein